MTIADCEQSMWNTGWMQASGMRDAMGLRATCAFGLIDRSTGAPHRINGRPLVILTRRPNEAAAALLKGRDSAARNARSVPQKQRRPL